MLLIRGSAGGTTLTGTLYERGERAPTFKGAPDGRSPYVWVCDDFYQVDSGGTVQTVADQEVHVAFESPLPRGYETRKRAIEGAKDHLRTQFARVGVPQRHVEVEVLPVDEPGASPNAGRA